MSQERLDLLGEVCPVPLLRTRERVKAMPRGAVLHVETDFARAVRNITHWCNREGHKYQILEPEPGVWELVIRK